MIDTQLGSQENGSMKTMLDLPDALMKQVRLRARRDGRKLNEAVADLLRTALAAAEEPAVLPTVVGKDEQTGLPLIECRHAAVPKEEMTPERVAGVLLALDVEWHHAAGR